LDKQLRARVEEILYRARSVVLFRALKFSLKRSRKRKWLNKEKESEAEPSETCLGGFEILERHLMGAPDIPILPILPNIPILMCVSVIHKPPLKHTNGTTPDQV
jgi:hypothetical protein